VLLEVRAIARRERVAEELGRQLDALPAFELAWMQRPHACGLPK